MTWQVYRGALHRFRSVGHSLAVYLQLKGHFTLIKLFSLTFVEVGVVFTKNNAKCVQKCVIFTLFIELNSKISLKRQNRRFYCRAYVER